MSAFGGKADMAMNGPMSALGKRTSGNSERLVPFSATSVEPDQRATMSCLGFGATLALANRSLVAWLRLRNR
jgi:hypothetical protein